MEQSRRPEDGAFLGPDHEGMISFLLKSVLFCRKMCTARLSWTKIYLCGIRYVTSPQVRRWVLVLAGLSDLARPADKLSLTQNAALMATGAIWTRWCLIIKPRNVLLAAVNFFVGCVGFTQVTRIFLHRRTVDGSTKDALKDMTHEATGPAKAAVIKAEGKVEELIKKH
ncbi:conserved hypothetical protein [Histoplasma capsulatum G186AR]|uniref:Mitochondrial pyruvate carrier n=1 Tax=Ajellomyces capsulatus (strain G186AR / H82 / ATCC MYA-2454 / RMSCC 2432) TaxID=447093 RepID=C0NHQ7_AJECG|nr:uncharacterized protein HCBG_02879 [Histoplasma capsulatum G186AR]EEH09342.1 conserved hypothetical protein [Histoplasma capsulatum G186AR]